MGWMTWILLAVFTILLVAMICYSVIVTGLEMGGESSLSSTHFLMHFTANCSGASRTIDGFREGTNSPRFTLLACRFRSATLN